MDVLFKLVKEVMIHAPSVRGNHTSGFIVIEFLIFKDKTWFFMRLLYESYLTVGFLVAKALNLGSSDFRG